MSNLLQLRSKKAVPNLWPTKRGRYKIAIIGEAPGESEYNTEEPFVGAAGEILMQGINSIGLSRAEVFLGNICQYKPNGNRIKEFATDSPEIQASLDQLDNDLRLFKPDLVICCGNTALSAFLPWSIEVTRKKVKKEIVFDPFLNDELGNPTMLDFAPKPRLGIKKGWKGQPTVTAYRGTFFKSSGHFKGYKCFATFHPSLLNYSYKDKWLFLTDLKKAITNIAEPFPTFTHGDFYDPFETVRDSLRGLLSNPPTEVGFDIEGSAETGVTCYSFAPTTRDAIFVGLIDITTHQQIYTDDETLELVCLTSQILYDQRIKKIMHNATYEMFTLAIRYQIYIRNYDDTMTLMWCLFSELKQSLAFASSLCTNVPYYKEDREVPDLKTHAEYNCKDSCVTLEVYYALRKDLDSLGEAAVKQYNMFMRILPAVVDFQLEGIDVDVEEIKRQYLSAMRKRKRIERAICAYYKLSSFNINATSSGGDRQNLLYNIMGLKKLTNKKTRNVKADKDALYTIARRERKSNRKVYQTCKLMIAASELSKEMGSLNALYQILPDGRTIYRSSFACPFSTTGRWNSKKSYLCGIGRNFQNVSSEEKAFFLVAWDEYLCQYDFSGADAWTVAAWSSHLGDRTMLTDLEHGIKPAKLIRYMIEHGFESFDNLSIEETKRLSKSAPDDKLYVGCKSRLYAKFYKGGLQKSLTEIYKKSKGKVSLEMKQLILIDKVIDKRYPGIKRWQNHQKKLLWAPLPMLKCGSGQTRIIFGKPNDDATHRELLASEPQANTTHWINLAIERFLYDPINRDENDHIIARPVITVHDSSINKFKVKDLDRARDIIPKCFKNKISIAGMDIECPAAGGIGKTWGSANKGEITI